MAQFGVLALRLRLREHKIGLPSNVIPYGFSSHSGGVWILQENAREVVARSLGNLFESGHKKAWLIHLDISTRVGGIHKRDQPDSVKIFSVEIEHHFDHPRLAPTEHQGVTVLFDHMASLERQFIPARAELDRLRVERELAPERSVAEQEKVFEPGNVEDARKRVLTAIVRRQGQPAFRNELLRAYGRRCAVTACAIEAVLEAAHISPYRGPETNHVTNGILLRADIHTLFDLGLIAIDAERWTVVLAPMLLDSQYRDLSAVTVPEELALRPSAIGLREHRKRAGI